MDKNRQQEHFSLAYVRAIASVAGCNPYEYPYDEGTDLGFEMIKNDIVSSNTKIDAQVKSTAKIEISDDFIKYDLEVKYYNDLRDTNRTVPKILIVVLVPKEIDGWLEQTEESLALKKCGYWMSLADYPEVNNENSIRIEIPRSQIFSPDQLTKLVRLASQNKKLQ